MKDRDRKLMRRRLDVEMRPFRRAGKEKHPSDGLLRAIRLALRIPVAEIAGWMGINRSNVFDLEEREKTGTIGLQSLSKMAEAMGCQVVYGIVPRNGKTMEALWEQRLWADVLGVPQLNVTEREGIAAVLSQQFSALREHGARSDGEALGNRE